MSGPEAVPQSQLGAQRGPSGQQGARGGPGGQGGSGAADAARPLARTRSFARRGDRMPDRHHAAYARLSATHVVDVPRPADGGTTTVDPAYRLDAEAVFGRTAPLVIEVGWGSGDAVRHGAEQRPGWDFLAFEVWRPGVAQALARMVDAPLGNVRFVEADAEQALGSMLAPGSVHELWTFFPDPWPKHKHHKRRLVNRAFADAVSSVLLAGGLWRLATDWAHYARQMRTVLDADERFELVSTQRAPLRPVTRFERKGLAAGRTITDLAYRRG